jgi:ectoine hydroxylase-related dioxygenase (phytanoyl-CoA dioxygenase family)
MNVTDYHLRRLRTYGYAVVPNFLGAAEVRAARGELFESVPTPTEFARHPMKYQAMMQDESLTKLEFPYGGLTLNRIATHRRILAAARRALGTADVRLARSAVWAKYAGMSSYDQEMHVDFEGNTLAWPRDDGDYRQLNVILYYSDVTRADLGPTYVVSQRKTGDDLWPARRYRRDWAALYKLEKPLYVKAGAMLMFSMRTFHRGSEVRAPGGARFTHHLVYRSARHEFQGHRCWASYGEYPEMARFIEGATVEQRTAIGFPPPGDAYWNAATLAGVKRRYPGMDMGPYRS